MIHIAMKTLSYATIALGLLMFAFGSLIWGGIIVLVGVVFSRIH